MKFSKLIPVALALTLVSPAFAAPADHADAVLNLEIGRFVNITTSTPTQTSATTVDDNYSTLTLTTPFNVAFNVITNDPDQKLTLSAKTTTADGAKEALFKNGSDVGIALANQTVKPSQESIANITGGTTPAVESNPNAVAFLFSTKSLTPKGAAQGGGTVSNTTVNQNSVVYSVTEGVYDGSYITPSTNMANTFDPHDTYGTYTATLTLTSTTTP